MNLRTALPFAGLTLMTACFLPAVSASERGHSMSTSSDHEPASDCSALHIRFDHQDAIIRSEEKTLNKNEVSVLRVHAQANGGVQVQGWDKDAYSVTACKAVGYSEQEAEQIFSQITFSVQNGEVSTSGPGDRDHWCVYLLIRAPKAANIDLDAKNGPVSFYSVDGKVKVRATNGPISVKGFSGEADITATNGPITLADGSGNLRMHAQNGPITVALKDGPWTGSGLVADTVNGPVTLHVPSGFQSSFLLESKGNGPVSCRASICNSARKTWEDERRRIEFGNGQPVVHLSAVNGPVALVD